ncbi:porin family protein [Spirosoma arcticum]
MNVNQFILYTLVWLTGPLLCKAQSENTFRVGLIGGVNFTCFIESNNSNNKLIVLYTAGLTLEQQLSKRLSIIGDLKYSRQGNTEQLSNPSHLYQKIVTNYDYFTTPIALRLKSRRAHVSFGAGLQIGYLAHNEVKLLPQKGYTNNNNPPFLRKTDFSWLIGIGHNFNRHFFAEISYNQSIIPLLKAFKGIDPLTGNYTVQPSTVRRNQVICASLRYYIKRA